MEGCGLQMKKELIRILFAIDGGEFGGGERVFAQLMNRLPAEEYEIFLASKANPDFYKAITNPVAHLIPLDFAPRINPMLAFRIAGIIRRNGIQIVNGQGGRAEFYARIAAKWTGVKYVSTIAMPVEGYDVPAPIRKIYSFFDHLSENCVDRFVVVSEALKERMIRLHGISPEKVVRIYNGIELEYFDPAEMQSARTKIRKELGADENRPLIAGIGRMVWQKGFDWLIRCFPAVLSSYPDALLFMVGDGPLRGRLQALARELKLADKVIFTGFRADVREILAGIDVFAVPSLLEGFPMVTLEAMAMGKAIVATDIEGMREQFENGRSGLLVPPEDPASLAIAINRLLADGTFSASIGAGARSRAVREFPIEKTVAETMMLYQSILHKESA